MPAASPRAKMTPDQALAALKKAGTDQNRKVYARHGVRPETMFGVSFAALGALAKKVKTDHDLATKLWKTGNHDARILATMIADPAALSASDINSMVRDLDNYVVTNAFAGLVAKTPHARDCAQEWTAIEPKQGNEFAHRAGFDLVSAHLTNRRKSAPDPATDLPDDFLAALLTQIQRDIHTAPNRAREGMNGCLISIGGYRESLRTAALAAAERIGPVEIDHGDTGCKTPYAPDYIRKVAAHSARAGAASAPKKTAARTRTAKKTSKKKTGRKTATKKRTAR